MPMTMHVDIVSAEESIYSGPVEEVYAPAEMGEVGIFPRHSPFISRLKPGEVRVKPEGKQELEFYFVSGGILEIQPHVVTVLADTAVRAKDLDEAAALEAKQRAEQLLSDNKGEIDYARAQSELLEAIAQLRMIEKMRKNLK
ncbi:MAG: F0F1 ATP synthase subunit epsilon [Gammaproteobacteria bacterium]|jgi:F-type H+-transporting ATPase subunit epsilon